MQITVHLKSAFVARLSEWAFAVVLMMWGLVILALPPSTYEASVYGAFRMLVGQDTLGVLFALGGAVRLAVLFGNGSWRPLYYARAWLALASTMVWTTIVLGFWSSGVIGTWLAVYPVLLVFDAVNVFRATADAAAAEREARSTG